MTPSQQTIQLIRDAIVSGNLQDAEKALEDFGLSCAIFAMENTFQDMNIIGFESEVDKWGLDSGHGVILPISSKRLYQLFNQSK